MRLLPEFRSLQLRGVDEAGTALVEAEATAAPTDTGTAKPAGGADVSAVLLAYLLVLAGWGIALLFWWWRNPSSFTPGDGISIFAPLYILAQSIERLVEPFSDYLAGAAAPDAGDGDGQSPNADGGGQQPTGKTLLGIFVPSATITKTTALDTRNTAIAGRDASLAAEWERVVDKIRRNTSVIAWGIASLLGILACGTFGLYMMRLTGFTAVPKQVDILISGLAVGSGTKPLHELISNLQKNKEQKEDPPEKKAA